MPNMPNMPNRPFLTKQQVAKVDALEKAYTTQDGSYNFACSGIYPPHAVALDKLALYYQKPSDTRTRGSIKSVTFPLTAETAKDIYNAGEPSPFGRGSELVYDQTYRQAHELKPPHFALTNDLLSASGLLALLAKKLDYEVPLEGRINKLNAYTEGGFFKTHKDTPQSQDHIGTLMICLPSPFSGGALVIRQNGSSITFDWGKQTEDGSFAWGFLYSDCEHEILPVTSGTRITIAYDIFLGKNGNDFKQSTFDTRLIPIMKAFKEILKPEFLPSGGSLAFGLTHGYPMSYGTQEAGLTARLKTSDAVLMAAINKLYLRWDYFGVYDYDRDVYNDDDDDTAAKVDLKAKKNDTTYRDDIWIADDFFAFEGEYVGDSEGPELERDLDLI
ncbi:hypothetical protein I302_100594 [Kwoniella bestiolae CBS 10118]|uniref:Fe2OG dioxygenase domain-containing protein n=1 Tax=Kwoniella bestiolae CBS 10118 TaxID=1296100 RepID=A0A1B9G5I6_9TREE|nr:hypothetical protein I302_03969 [Kwoniella bestiolae CBS 10118]OCF26286.1 hypothetical protein I302_03969 [Kwoniella bestiolae CBS 10118]